MHNFGVPVKCIVEAGFDFLTYDVRSFCKDDGVTLGSIRENWLKNRRMSYWIALWSFAFVESRLGARVAFCHSSEQSFSECTTNGSSPGPNVRRFINPTFNFYTRIYNIVSMIHHKNAAHTSITFCMISFNIILTSALMSPKFLLLFKFSRLILWAYFLSRAYCMPCPFHLPCSIAFSKSL